MARIAGIDYGKARIGIAVSDEREILASPICCLKTGKTLEETAKTIAQELSRHVPLKGIVIGLPLQLKGEDSPMSKEVRELAKLLMSLCPVPITLWDERLTTAQVERTLKESHVSRKKRSEKIDALCAALILQSFLDSPR